MERDVHAYDLLAAHMESWYQSQGEVEQRLNPFRGFSRVALWGSGFHTEMLYQLTSLFRYSERQFLLVDLDPLKQNQTWRGIPIQKPDALRDVDWSKACFIPSSYQHHDAMRSAAIGLGVPEDRIVRLYDRVRVR